MPCDACNTPTTPAIAAPRSAVLTNPVTAPAQSCYTPPENPCSPPVSRLRNLGKYVPGWVQKLTPAAMGRLVIAVGDALHWFRPNNPGPLYFDGENVTVGGQPTLTAKATEDSLVEFGHLTLAKKVSRAQILPDGSPATLEFFEHGVQAVREIGVGEMMGLTTDPASGSVRMDVIQPEARDLIKKGLPAGFRRFGFVETQVEGVCGLQQVKKFYDYQGAVFDSSEILLDRDRGLPAVLLPTKTANGYTYAIGSEKYIESEGITQEQFDEGGLRIPVVTPIYGDSECPEKVTGFTTKYISFPEYLVLGKASRASRAWLDAEIKLLDVLIEGGTVSRSSAPTEVEIDIASYGIPEAAKSLTIRMLAWVRGQAGGNYGAVVMNAGKFGDEWLAGLTASNGTSVSNETPYYSHLFGIENPHPITVEIPRSEDGKFYFRHDYYYDNNSGTGPNFELKAQVGILGYSL